VRRFNGNRGRLLAFERNIDYAISEDLKQAGGNEPLERSIEIEVTFPEPAYLYDLCATQYCAGSCAQLELGNLASDSLELFRDWTISSIEPGRYQHGTRSGKFYEHESPISELFEGSRR
jgi:hypothetical protein